MGKPKHVAQAFSNSDFSLSRLLGGMTPAAFLADHWQKKPLLVRQALPGFGDWLDRDSMSELACRDDAESRLVRVNRGRWLLDHGPFQSEDLDTLPKRGWSLLISGVNHLLPEADRLLHSFNFIPYARLDDLMVSYAPPGGGVGPHFDSYDVFLIQGKGRRRWEISGQEDLELVEGAPLRILKHFTADESWVLEPGDMLYLPPKFAHNGVALDDCMTWSVGFRAPTAQEMMSQFLIYLQDHLEVPGMYADPERRFSRHPGEIPTDLLRWVEGIIRTAAWGKAEIGDFLGRYLSEPKAHIFFDPPSRPLSPAKFAKTITQRGIHLDPRTQFLYRGQTFFMNGERIECAGVMAAALRELADKRELPGAKLLDQELISLCHHWYTSGYVSLT